jgi:Uncharacterized protein conserved in bacteria (DUF2147)
VRSGALVVIALVVGMAVGPSTVKADEPSAAGLWEQSDSKGHVGAWFLIFERGGTYEGALAKIFPRPGDESNPVCSKCPGDQQGQPLLGLTIIKGMKRNGLAYENGSILDPRDGSVYRARMEVTPDGSKLKVRGYLGVSLLGRTQVWKRLPSDALAQSEVPTNLKPFWDAAFSASSGKS